MSKSVFRRAIKWMLVLWALLMVGVGGLLVNVIWFKPFSIDLFFERVFIEYALHNPQMLTDLRILEPYGITGHNAKLNDESPAFALKMWEKSRRDLETLQRYHRAELSPDRQLSYDILNWFLDDSVRSRPFLYHNYPVNQLFGIQNDLPTFMAMKHSVHTVRDAEHYLKRLAQFDAQFNQVLEGLRLREQNGIVPPKFVLTRVIAEIQGFASAAPTENILYTSFKDKLAKTDAISEADKTELLARVAATIEKQVYPAYQSLYRFLCEQESRATADDGVWKFPDGDTFYAHALRSNTTAEYTPDQVHEMGLTEVARISTEMEAILASVGKTGKSVGELMAELQRDPAHHYPDTEEGRRQCLKDYEAIIGEISAGLGGAFDLRPTIGVEVRRVPEFREKTSAGAYYEPPSLDGSRPGVFFANLRDMNEISKWGMRTLAYHEAIPGHHFQFAIQQETKGPTFRRVIPFTAYAEGWALYAERLAWELGFQEDPYSNLGRLQAELFRAVRLVVDTGIHYKRWTREQAIEYMLNTTGMGEGEVTAEIERYIVMPGQACAYKIGMMKILELREKARNELGDKFSIKEFHNAVLANGSLPLTVLEDVVDRYIAQKKAA